MTMPSDWDPLKEMLLVQKRLNGLFESALARTEFDAREGVDSWTPVSDAHESPEALILSLELPGLEQDQIDLRIDGDELVVEGVREMAKQGEGDRYHRVECSYGKFSRRFHLPSAIDREAVEAVYRNGVLRVSLPRKGRELPKSVRVAIR
jgi:HSP20 family protein